jgi:F-type H+-transporting ATPase subunit gamma
VATLREIRRRIKSVKNTQQITKAMELVAASKMRRAQEHVLSSRPYTEKMHTVLSDLSSRTVAGAALHPLLTHHTTGRVCLVFLTSDRGLCGSFNTNMIRHALDFMDAHKRAGEDVALVPLGKRGFEFMVRARAAVLSQFTDFPDKPTIHEHVAPVVNLLTNGYRDGTFKSVSLAYSQFVSTMTQRPLTVPLLPITEEHLAGAQGEDDLATLDYIFEPSASDILDTLLPRYVEVQVYQALLESIASEQSARMVAMRNATDNALDIIDSLTLTYNKARQAAITRELIDIATSAAAIG